MKKRLFTPILTVSMILSCSAVSAADNEVKVYLDGTQLQFEQPPVIQDGRTLVPMRAIFEALGADVDWQGETQYIVATSSSKGQMIEMHINNNIITHNGVDMTLDVAPQLINGYTMIPLRVVSECMDANVEWDGNTRTVYVTNKNSIIEIYGNNTHYIGECMYGVAQGYGMLFVSDDTGAVSELYCAYFENNGPVEGYVRYANGDMYQGGFSNFEYNGKGTIFFADNSMFTDVFTNGYTSGNGIWQIDGVYYTESEMNDMQNQTQNQTEYNKALNELNKWYDDTFHSFYEQDFSWFSDLYSDFLETDIAKNIFNKYGLKGKGDMGYNGAVNDFFSAQAANAKTATVKKAEAELHEAYNVYVQEYMQEFPEYLKNLYNEKLAELKIQYGITD